MARKAGKLKVSLDEVSQTIDLETFLDKKPTETEKQKFSEIALAFIESRSLDGININGSKFKKYSKEYAAAKGVSRSSVDMFLSGDMFDAMDRDSKGETESTVKLSIVDKDELPKAFNHQKGDTLPKREWFGLTQEDASLIADEIAEPKSKKLGALAKTVTQTAAGTTRKTTLADLEEALEIIGLE